MAKKTKKGALTDAQREARERRSTHKRVRSEIGLRIMTASKVKQYFSEQGVRMDAKVMKSVAGEVFEMLYKAVERCHANNRKTVRPSDL